MKVTHAMFFDHVLSAFGTGALVATASGQALSSHSGIVDAVVVCPALKRSLGGFGVVLLCRDCLDTGWRSVI